jgi:hypothetical protein
VPLNKLLTGRPPVLIIAGILVVGLMLAGFAFGALTRATAPIVAAEADIAAPATVATPRTVEQILPGAAKSGQAEVRDVESTAVPAPKAVAKAKSAPKAVTPSAPSIAAYRGLGSWVDIYDDRAWTDPAGTMRDMAGHGVKTLYIETSNSHSAFILKDPGKMATFIETAHALKMRVVAWYLPEMTNTALDFDRVKQAIEFKTPKGQSFDSFALDIESDKVGSVPDRNNRLMDLSSRIRTVAGRTYPLGAIIPSPGAMAKPGGYWHEFPYEKVAAVYDVFVPMSYYTYHGDGASVAYADTIANMRALRSQPGCSKEPIHLIGGEATASSPTEVREFVRAARETGAVGASLYTWDGTTTGHWSQLAGVN